MKSVERMGKRRLAYVVRKFQDGIYVLMMLEGDGGMVKEIERRLRVNEPVIKFLTVRVDEEQKRLAKVKALRDTKVRGKGTRAAAAEAAAAAASCSSGGGSGSERQRHRCRRAVELRRARSSRRREFSHVVATASKSSASAR